jgi:ligand-binding SRPBCC domain-containing protein
MKIHTLKRVQKFPIDINQAWDFFTAPQNLGYIIPRYMKFELKSEIQNRNIQTGQILEYRIRPKFNIPLQWVTEITHVQEPHLFIDQQRIGPYRIWHHEHIFKEDYNGVEMTDIVTFALPYGLLGNGIYRLFVKNDLNYIFNYRSQILDKYFNQVSSAKLAS